MTEINNLTTYAMRKAIDKEIEIVGISLFKKNGGKNGPLIRNQ
ncbi:MAG: hypothetical protein KAU22_01920 [Desulfuromonadales bacterium]|nr:hypothetical protein [Desulfuromonadales bacterium]